jgi:hypothetical protein
MAKKAIKKDLVLDIPELKIRQATFMIKGKTPLIMNRFDEKMQGKMLEKQMGKASEGKTLKDPEDLYKRSIYWFADGKRSGFPAVGFKAAMTRAGKQLGLNMTDTRGKFHIIGDENELVEIKGKHQMRSDMVRLQTGVADIRFRACYPEWSAAVTISYNENAITKEQLANLLRVAGFACGIGEWRPEKSNSGSYGLFDLATK